MTILRRQIDEARADGAMASLPQTLGPLSALLVQGRVRAAEAMLEEAEALAAATGMPTVYPRVHLAALRGSAPKARRLFDSVIADATVRGETMLISYTRFCEAMLHNGLGDYATALRVGREPTRPSSSRLPAQAGGAWRLRFRNARRGIRRPARSRRGA